MAGSKFQGKVLELLSSICSDISSILPIKEEKCRPNEGMGVHFETGKFHQDQVALGRWKPALLGKCLCRLPPSRTFGERPRAPESLVLAVLVSPLPGLSFQKSQLPFSSFSPSCFVTAQNVIT